MNSAFTGSFLRWGLCWVLAAAQVCSGFGEWGARSGCGACLLIEVASLVMERGPQGPQASVVAERGLRSCGPQAVEHRLDGCGAWP